MKIIYLSSASRKEDKEKIDKTARKKLENNIILFHNGLIDGLACKDEVNEVVSIIGLPISHKTNRKVFWQKQALRDKKKKYIQLGLINLPVLKQLTLNYGFYREVKKESEAEDSVIVYDASFVSIFPVINYFLRKKNTKGIAIFADFYDYMLPVERKTKHLQIIKQVAVKLARKVYNMTDGYVFLTKYMKEALAINGKPSIIIDGVFSGCATSDDNKRTARPTVLYAGGLREEYGIQLLLDVASNCAQNIHFSFYGDGPLKNEIISASKKNKNISYYGLLANDEILKKESEAWLLINLRYTDAEYTKYSFPSKVIEYLASGTPVLTTRLPGISSSYDKYLNYVDKIAPEQIREQITHILSDINYGLYTEKAKRAKRFIIDNKTPLAQAEKIIKLINEL